MGMAYSSKFNLEALKQNLFSKQKSFNKDMHQEVQAGAQQIAAQSASNAPVDTHNLEQAHHITKTLTQSDNVRFSVEVSGTGYGSDDPRDVSNYALDMHENLAPYGSGEYNLGPDSQAKALAGHDVGGKYLERAIESEKPEVIEKVRRAVKKNFGNR